MKEKAVCPPPFLKSTIGTAPNQVLPPIKVFMGQADLQSATSCTCASRDHKLDLTGKKFFSGGNAHLSCQGSTVAVFPCVNDHGMCDKSDNYLTCRTLTPFFCAVYEKAYGIDILTNVKE
jgi:hypothetical protein